MKVEEEEMMMMKKKKNDDDEEEEQGEQITIIVGMCWETLNVFFPNTGLPPSIRVTWVALLIGAKNEPRPVFEPKEEF